jgi:lipopolysaccharide/colanic/teichoic acid biosynthesis glycosyltransferase
MRRFIDICVASIVLLFLSPAFTLICLLVVLDSTGGPFYGGWRAGKDSRRFRMWKFRTMVQDADRQGGAITTRCDPRITRVGNFLRKSKLDELPQFCNLLAGDLTLVGPRPEDPSIAEQYSLDQKQVLSVKPGITGPTQLHYTALEAEAIPDGADAELYYIRHILDPKVRFDLEYLRRRTFISDLRVVFQTISLMFRAITQSTQS